MPQGVGAVLVDQDHNMPDEPGSDYTSSIDFRSAYLELWGS